MINTDCEIFNEVWREEYEQMRDQVQYQAHKQVWDDLCIQLRNKVTFHDCWKVGYLVFE